MTSAPRIVVVSVIFFPMGLFYYSSANGVDLHHQHEKSDRCLGYEGVTSVQLRHASTGQSKTMRVCVSHFR